MLSALIAGFVLAAPAEVVVYDLEVDGFSDRQRTLAQYSILTELNKREGLRAIGIDEARERAGFREELGCEPKDCLAQLVDAIGSDVVVTGRITRLGTTTAIALRVVDLRERAVVASSTRQLALSKGEGVLAALGPMVEELFEAHPVRSGASTGVTRTLQERWEPAPVPQAVFFSGLAITVATAAAGVAFGVRAVQKRNDFEATAANSSPENPANGIELIELEDQFETARNISNAFFAASAASAVITTTLFFFTDFGEDPVLTVGPTSQGLQVGATLRF